MILKFYKYQAVGNDFIMIDNRNLNFDSNNNILIEKLCNRRFGIGADGLILINNSDRFDFNMQYFNSDGYEGSMCGNGGRCSIAFASFLNIIKEKTVFNAIDGIHEGLIISSKNNDSLVKIKMKDVDEIKKIDDDYFINTGSPHYIRYVENIDKYDVFNIGKNLQKSEIFENKGSNINFVEKFGDKLKVRTYERGVEDETLSCGTGSVASAIYANKTNLINSNSIDIIMPGGELNITFEINNNLYHNVWLKGLATQVFYGELTI